MNKYILIFVLILVIIVIIISKYKDCQNYKKYYIENNSQYVQSNYELNKNYKNIFCFWDSDILPPLINECVKNYKKKLPDWNTILLNEKNIHNFIDKTEFPINYNNLKITQKSDWIRLFLLYKYGGLWMDASIIINDPSEINYMYDKVFKENYEISGYSLSDKIFMFKNFKPFESWFILSKKNSEIIYKWMKEYEYAIEIGFESYNNSILSFHDFQNYFGDNYWTVYTCFQNTILKNEELYNYIYMKNCNETMFHHRYLSVIHILLDNTEKNIKLIKIDRKIIDELFMEDIINKFF